MAQINTRISKRQRLLEEKEKLHQEHQEAQRIELDRKAAAEIAKLKFKQANSAWETADQQRGNLEEEYVKKLEQVPYEAAMQWLQEQIRDGEAQDNVIEQEKINKETDERKKTLRKSMETRWTDTKQELFSRRNKVVIRKGEVNSDYATLMDQGPEVLARQIIDEQYGKTPEAQAIKDDPALLKEMGKKAATRLLAHKIKLGGIDTSQARTLADSDWGAQAVEDAIAYNKSAADIISKLTGVDATTPGWFKAIKNNKAISILTILGIAFGAIPLVLLTGPLGIGAAGGAIGGIIGGTGGGIGGLAIGQKTRISDVKAA